MHGLFPFCPFHILFLLTSTGQTGTPISMVEGSNNAFPPNEVPFWGIIEKFDFTGSVTPKNRQKVGVVISYRQIQDSGSRHYKKLKLL
jgi:hypothetical protein